MNRRTLLASGIAATLALMIAGCGGMQGSNTADTQIKSDDAQEELVAEPAEEKIVAIKDSPDKYTWYVKNYVGMNAASVGYTSLGGDRRDSYGAGTLKVVFRANDGSYVDIDDEESLQGFKVIGQDLAPNTEIKYTIQIDEDGEEYENLVDAQNYDEIVLAVVEVGSNEPAPELTEVKSSPDKYTRYVKDYVGRNLASCGYYSMGGTYNDHYGLGYVKFDIAAEDGSYIDPEDKAQLGQYVVTAQSVEPNSEITMTFMKDSNGEEYSNLVESQSLESISLTVKKLND